MNPETPVILKIYDPSQYERLSEVDYSEVRRYGGMMVSRSPIPEPEGADISVIDGLIDECVSEIMPVCTYRLCYRRVNVLWEDGRLKMPFDTHGSRNLAHNLEGCSEAVMFAATIGVGIDRLIAKYNRTAPSKALIMQALGAERIEALCELFNAEVTAEERLAGRGTKPRFSPGYGDLPLTVQKEFMTLLDCAHLVGINLNESLLMSPSKSVTAVIGINNG